MDESRDGQRKNLLVVGEVLDMAKGELTTRHDTNEILRNMNEKDAKWTLLTTGHPRRLAFAYIFKHHGDLYLIGGREEYDTTRYASSQYVYKYLPEAESFGYVREASTDIKRLKRGWSNLWMMHCHTMNTLVFERL